LKIQCYTLSLSRYPNHIKTLYHRCLAYSKVNNVEDSIQDCLLYFEKIKEMEENETILDLNPKFNLRLARSYFEKSR
jgi:hypothetical protein